MRTSAPGSDGVARRPAASLLQRGFTLIELLVVVAIIAIATAGVAFALRDDSGTRLEQEARRLSALFESARAQSRTTGVPVVWHAVEGGFRFEGLPEGALPQHWLHQETRVVQGAGRVVLGPEPIIGRQEVVLGSIAGPGRMLRIVTDGLGPFVIAEVSP
ncbi:type II secretion system protein GspH [Ramlibacter henchirensis]|uniref:Type II secretion system protein GspH n=1 Tax=Ramlibacter henchirensis TaxID=204072 RepID=A0A4Z0C4T7_9BURK|nr:prepilin-type N-terminal cleavage/methylation domain-containing protein [Ramlibacter henchirensis]TFZ06573.1 type II secretion system protein GspH [Ramlibacter henchirensis]